MFTLFDPGAERPARFPSPFGAAHPLARQAAAILQRDLGSLPALAEQERGKMFGVLVVEDAAGQVGFLRAFSGMLGGRWRISGFVGPLFDEAARDAVWPGGEAELDAFDRELADLERSLDEARATLQACHQSQRRRATELREQHDARQAARRARRSIDGHHALDQESRADTAERRQARAAGDAERAPLARQVAALEAAILALKHRRVARSRELLEVLFAGYRIPGPGGPAGLRSLFAPATPPGGAGDCAAPKLMGHALDHGLRPLALAEFWWGRPPAQGGRQHGVFYPACRGKCGPILAHMFLDLEPAPEFGAAAIPPDEPRIVYEDRWLVVADKPPGLLSVPGRTASLTDSVQTRLGCPVVHRLDLDTSGLIIAARDAGTQHAMQALFRQRRVEKGYVAWLDGDVSGDAGTIDLALRVDLDDRPRQIHDPIHGKPALTTWRVLARAAGRTRVALRPETGRTHQLRVHASHPRGLGAPIVGDRLYGTNAERLLLHAESLAFTHPHTGERIALTRPAPF